MRAIFFIVTATLIVTVMSQGCDLVTLGPTVERPTECGTTEVGQAYGPSDTLITATKVYVCRETNVGWELSYCWFELDNDLPLEEQRRTCETWRGWHRAWSLFGDEAG